VRGWPSPVRRWIAISVLEDGQKSSARKSLQTAGELPGHSEYGFLAKLLVAQKYYDIGDIEECLFMMDVFHQHIEAFLMSGHISDESASLLYDAYAEVVECLGGTPLRPLPP